MKCHWTNYDDDCKYCFDRHCTLPPSDIDDKPDDAECKREIKNEYGRFVNRQLKGLKRDCGLLN